MIELKNITVDFDGFKAVDDVSLTINEQDTFGIVGYDQCWQAIGCDR